MNEMSHINEEISISKSVKAPIDELNQRDIKFYQMRINQQ